MKQKKNKDSKKDWGNSISFFTPMVIRDKSDSVPVSVRMFDKLREKKYGKR